MNESNQNQQAPVTTSTLLLTVPQAAKLLQLGRNRTYELASAGVIPSVRIGNTIRIPRSALERWVEEQARAA